MSTTKSDPTVKAKVESSSLPNKAWCDQNRITMLANTMVSFLKDVAPKKKQEEAQKWASETQGKLISAMTPQFQANIGAVAKYIRSGKDGWINFGESDWIAMKKVLLNKSSTHGEVSEQDKTAMIRIMSDYRTQAEAKSKNPKPNDIMAIAVRDLLLGENFKQYTEQFKKEGGSSDKKQSAADQYNSNISLALDNVSQALALAMTPIDVLEGDSYYVGPSGEKLISAPDLQIASTSTAFGQIAQTLAPSEKSKKKEKPSALSTVVSEIKSHANQFTNEFSRRANEELLDKTRAKVVSAEAKLKEADAQVRALTTGIEESRQAAAGLQQQLTTAQANIASVTQQLQTSLVQEQQLSTHIGSIEASLKTSTESNTSLQVELQTLRQQQEALKTESQGLAAQLASAKQQESGLQDQLQAATTKITSLEADLKASKSTVDSLQGEVTSLTARVATQEEQIKSLQTENSQLTGQIGTLQQQVASQGQQLSESAMQVSAKSTENESLRQQLASKDSELTSKNDEIAELKRQIEVMRAQQATVAPQQNTEVAGLQKELKEARDKLVEQKAKADKMAAKIAEKDKEISELSGKNGSLVQQAEEFIKRLADKPPESSPEITRQKEEIEQQKEKIASLEKQLEDARAQSTLQQNDPPQRKNADMPTSENSSTVVISQNYKTRLQEVVQPGQDDVTKLIKDVADNHEKISDKRRFVLGVLGAKALNKDLKDQYIKDIRDINNKDITPFEKLQKFKDRTAEYMGQLADRKSVRYFDNIRQEVGLPALTKTSDFKKAWALESHEFETKLDKLVPEQEPKHSVGLG